MFVLALIWLVVGMLMGSIAYAARLQPALWRKRGVRGWLYLLLIGALAALVGGSIGTLVLGRFFAVACAVWVSVLCVVGLPWLMVHGQRFLRSSAHE